jgi:hypothetical protein
MPLLTLGHAKTALARYADGGVCSDDQRATDLINLAVERLVDYGKWKGLVVRYDFYVYQKLVTLPREIETPLAITLNNQVPTIQNRWYEFKGNGSGPWDPDVNAWSHSCVDRGETGTIYDLPESLRVGGRSMKSETAGQYVWVFGYDSNNQWVRTEVDGVWVDGERISLDSTLQLTTTVFSKVTRINKPITNGEFRLYAYYDDGTTAVLGVYHHSEEDPVFRRYLVTNAEDCELQCCTVIAKKRYLPAVHDTDVLLIQSLNALRFMLMAIHKEDVDEPDTGEIFEQKAIRVLKKQLAEHAGDSSTGRLSVERNFGASGIPSL